jgi:hypothetical protein
MSEVREVRILINGKIAGTISIPGELAGEALDKFVFTAPTVVAALAGRQPLRLIHGHDPSLSSGKLVLNIVAK